MVKAIIKELFIMILLLIAISLLVGIMFYDYIPSKKVVPVKEAYYTPENVQEELDEQITEMEKTELSYEITDTDLLLYKQTSSYKPGKKDPFSLKEEKPENTGNGNSSTSTSQTSGNTQKNNSGTQLDDDENASDETNTFWEDPSIK